MDKKKIEKLAAKNAHLPSGLNAAEQILYQSLTLLYRRYSSGMMETAAAKQERREILRQYEDNKFNIEVWQKNADWWKELEGPIHDYWENPTIGKANRIIDMVYGCKHIWKKTE
jgi:hypothetical protein